MIPKLLSKELRTACNGCGIISRIKVVLLLLMLLCAGTVSAESGGSAGGAGSGGSGGGAGGGELIDKFLWSSSVYVTSLPTSDSTSTPPPPPSNYIRTFGVSENATDGFDRGIDVTAPPLPLVEALDVYYPCCHEVVTRLKTDIRPDSSSINWNLKLSVPADSTVYVSWNTMDVPSDRTLKMTCGNKDIDMKSQGFTTFESGTYSLSVTANKVSENSRPTGSSGGGNGGGGGGGSPEPQSNVDTKELSQQFVANGKHVKFEFTRGATDIDYVEFDARKCFGKVTTLVEVLKDRSTLTPDEPDGKVYKYLNIWVGSGGLATPENINSPVIGFKVEKAWLEKNNILESSVRLWRCHDDIWTPLSVKIVSEDDVYVRFEAETPGFSPFAISGIQEDSETQNVSDGINSENSKISSADGNTSNSAEKREDEKMPGPGMVTALGLLVCAYSIRKKY